ncbi:Rrf2 family transcriptional regulator [Micromonospora sp. 15K316]|uniref:RrF2 family transcriptional regulator n=1 Tax=Micromonospora sp. 15K316 TaxID=2530376 RepID=UPI00104C897E|nr:Rrf2 family transcriptional regulator [Micromonospora sp. 15K316]TDC39386.1 Rrf2 family transcriptional regulator [Micromonospora sp. 15K316]
MQLNQSTDIGLRVVMLLGTRGGKTTVDELAQSLAVPRNHLAKIVQRLQHLGLIETIRGRGGGVLLADGATTASIGGLIRRLEADGEVVNCDTPACPLRAGCRLRGALRRAQEAFYASLDEVTIGDLLHPPTRDLLLSLTTR